MTEGEFKIHWQRILDKYTRHFKNDDHETREYVDWFNMFGGYSDEQFKETLDYYFRYLAKGWFPPMSDIENCLKLVFVEHNIYTHESIESNSFNNSGNLRPLYENIESLKKRIVSGEVPIGFTDNNVNEKYVGAARGDTKSRKVEYTSIKSLAECFVQMWDQSYEAPALAEYRRQKMSEEHIDKRLSDLMEGYVDINGRKVKQKICYYCEGRVEKNEDIFECEKCGVKYQ